MKALTTFILSLAIGLSSLIGNLAHHVPVAKTSFIRTPARFRFHVKPAEPKPETKTERPHSWSQIVSAIHHVFGNLGSRFEGIAECEVNQAFHRGYIIPDVDVGSQGEVGPLQVHPVHKPLVAKLGFTWEQVKNDPLINAKVAKAVYVRQGITAWSCA